MVARTGGPDGSKESRRAEASLMAARKMVENAGMTRRMRRVRSRMVSGARAKTRRASWWTRTCVRT